MNEIKHNGKKWHILVCNWEWHSFVFIKILDNYGNVMEVLNTFFGVISPFLIGIFIGIFIIYAIQENLKSYMER